MNIYQKHAATRARAVTTERALPFVGDAAEVLFDELVVYDDELESETLVPPDPRVANPTAGGSEKRKAE